MTKTFQFRLTDARRAKLEAIRIRRGGRSIAEIINELIDALDGPKEETR